MKFALKAVILMAVIGIFVYVLPTQTHAKAADKKSSRKTVAISNSRKKTAKKSKALRSRYKVARTRASSKGKHISARVKRTSSSKKYTRKKVATYKIPLAVASRGSHDSVISIARQFLGRPYLYGAAGPLAFDCSGFTQYVYRLYGISLPRSSFDQDSVGYSVSKGALQPGDLVFFRTNSSGRVSHVGIYIGNGRFIHSPSSGKTVSIANLSQSYYAARYAGARRVA